MSRYFRVPCWCGSAGGVPSTTQRVRRRFAPIRAAAAIAAAAGVTVVWASVATASGSPDSLFRSGYDLCHALSLPALEHAAGQTYRSGSFAGGTCTWETADLGSQVSLSVHPASFAALLQGYLKGPEAEKVKVPGASEGILLRLSTPHGFTQELYALLSKGLVQVNVSTQASEPDSLSIAVMEAVVAG